MITKEKFWEYFKDAIEMVTGEQCDKVPRGYFLDVFNATGSMSEADVKRSMLSGARNYSGKTKMPPIAFWLGELAAHRPAETWFKGYDEVSESEKNVIASMAHDLAEKFACDKKKNEQEKMVSEAKRARNAHARAGEVLITEAGHKWFRRWVKKEVAVEGGLMFH